MAATLRSRVKLIARALSGDTAPIAPLNGVVSYSASAEDLIARALLIEQGVDLSKVFYVDIGAAEPEFLSNTILFYRCGASGVLVDPDPVHIEKLKAARGRDTILPIGVSAFRNEEMELFRLTDGVFNTFSREMAESVVKQSASWAPHQRQQILETIKVPVEPINHVLSRHCANRTIHFMSIDIEGANFEILSAINFDRFRPIVLCVEKNASLADHNVLLGPFGYRLRYESSDNFMFVCSH